MGLRWRQSGEIVCAAENDPMSGDVYIDDGLQYKLAEEVGILHSDDNGDSWYFAHPIHALRNKDTLIHRDRKRTEKGKL